MSIDYQYPWWTMGRIDSGIGPYLQVLQIGGRQVLQPFIVYLCLILTGKKGAFTHGISNTIRLGGLELFTDSGLMHSAYKLDYSYGGYMLGVYPLLLNSGSVGLQMGSVPGADSIKRQLGMHSGFAQ